MSEPEIFEDGPLFIPGDRVMLTNRAQQISALYSKKAIFGTVQDRPSSSRFAGALGEKAWKYIYVLRDGNTMPTWWKCTDWQPIDRYRANIFADWLEDRGEITAAELLREAFPLG